MSNYEDPHWYEEQDTIPPQSQQRLTYDDRSFHTPLVVSSNGTPPRGSAKQRSPRGSTQPPRRFLAQALLLIALLAVAFTGGWFGHEFFGNSFNQSQQSKSYAQLFQQAWTTVDQNYVDRKAVNYRNMSYSAIQAMVDSLHDNNHTRFLTPDQVQQENQQLNGTFTGIGIYLRQDPTTKQLIIASTIPGSPAEKAGFEHGDIILAVDGKSVAGKDIPGVSSLIQGKAGTPVAITVQRPSDQHTLTIRVTRAEIKVPNVIFHYIAESHIAHIQIVQFSDGVSGDLKNSLAQAKSMGANKIILDLRDNPGGYLNEAINTASQFMKSGNVLLEQDSSGHRTPIPVNGNAIDTTNPIVVLVNGNTASAAEIVSGALQDNHRATIIGERTFGTGTVLQQFTLSDGSAILLGTQEWLTPDGHFIRDSGITPNIKVTLNANTAPLTPNDENAAKMSEQQILAGGDAQLVAAINYLRAHPSTA